MVEVEGPVFVTGCGAFLPGEPVSGDQAERLLDCVDGRPSRLRRRVLAANGIATRHYALDAQGNTTMLNEELAARAVEAALAERGITLAEVGMLAAGTTQGDVLVPGFASMVHGRLGGGPLETLSAGGVCCSGMAAFKAAAAAVRLGEHPVAVAVGSELVSRSLKATRYAGPEPGLDAEFLRWMLSDGAGAVVLEGEPRPAGPSLRVDWVHLASYAHEHPTCMYAGTGEPRSPDAGGTWLDQPTIAAAEAAGLLRLRQDTRALPGLVELGVAELARLTLRGLVDPARVDHLLCHYSSERFRPEIHRLLEATGLAIPRERWVTNLPTRGNTGAASIFVMLEECWRTGRFRPGDRGPAHGPRVGPLHRGLRPPHLRRRGRPGTAPARPGRGRGRRGRAGGQLLAAGRAGRRRRGGRPLAAAPAGAGVGRLRAAAALGRAGPPDRGGGGDPGRVPAAAGQPARAARPAGRGRGQATQVVSQGRHHHSFLRPVRVPSLSGL
jgi:3-oxoacyl-[acyl-carrier-protein] synthase III